MNKGMFSSKTDEWETPQELFDELNGEFRFTLDPCATKENAKCKRFYTKEDDGLRQDWAGQRVFMNPPYGEKSENGSRRRQIQCLCRRLWWLYYRHGQIRSGFGIIFTTGSV